MINRQRVSGRPRSDRSGELDEIDRRALEFAARHPVVLVGQLRALLDVREPSAVTARLDALIAAGLLTHVPRLRHQGACCQITSLGLREIGSELPVPRVDLRRYWHDLAAAELWLAAHAGSFGEPERVFCEREMRAADRKAAAARPSIDPGWSPAVKAKAADFSFGLRLAPAASSAAALLHYPDLILVFLQGRAAFELQLTATSSRPLESILSAYGHKASIAAVVYLVEDGAIGESVQAVAARLDLARLVHVQRVRLGWRRIDS